MEMGAISPGLPEEFGSLLSSLSATGNLNGISLHEPSRRPGRPRFSETIRAAAHTTREPLPEQCQAHEKSRKNAVFREPNHALKSRPWKTSRNRLRGCFAVILSWS